MPRIRITPGLDPSVDDIAHAEKLKRRDKRHKEFKQLAKDDPDIRAALEEKARKEQLWKRYITPQIAYDPILADAVLDLIAQGYSLKRVCEREGMPSMPSIHQWTTRHKDFGDRYIKACILKAQVWADEIMDISDDSRNDWEQIEDKNGEVLYRFNHDHVKRQQMRIDTRKWYLAHILPKQFGDAQLIKLADAEGNKLPPQAPTLIVRGIAPKARKPEGD
jgi:hypothetical protein